MPRNVSQRHNEIADDRAEAFRKQAIMESSISFKGTVPSNPRSLWVHLFVAIAVGFIAVALPMGYVLLLPWAMLILLRVTIWADESDRCARIFGIHFLTASIISIAAIVAPIKTEDRILSNPIRLPMKKSPLQDFDRFARSANYVELPIRLTLGLREDSPKRTEIVRFSAEEITLKEFFETLEKQHGLSRRIRGCGNGYSLLFGFDSSIEIVMVETHEPAR